jgi:hypothetical protein
LWKEIAPQNGKQRRDRENYEAIAEGKIDECPDHLSPPRRRA